MDYAMINHASWSTYLPTFKVLLRPTSVQPPELTSAAGPIALSLVLEQARELVPQLGTVSDKLVPLVFEGYQEWLSYEDSWILEELAQVLDDNGDQENLILSALDELVSVAARVEKASELTKEELQAAVHELDIATPASTMLAYLERCVSAWQDEASKIGALQQADAAETGGITGEFNSNWEQIAIPGTRYWIFYGNSYRYSDHGVAPLEEWASIQAREDAAETAKRPWEGAPGWSCTPVGAQFQVDYGGAAYVFRHDPDGSWMTLPKANEAMVQAQADNLTGEIPGEINPNWKENSIPGTRYWIFYENDYLYSDDKVAPLQAWATLQACMDAAEVARRPWEGAPGWSYTPVGARFRADYASAAYVFRQDPDGPWMTQPKANEAIAEAQAEQLQ